MRKHLPILAVLLLSIAVHFAYFGNPRQTVFDEVHFGKFVSGYFTHEYYFDIHPPLGKLIISGAGYLANFTPGFSFGQIGEQFPDNTYMALRLLPSIAGTLLPVIIVLLLLELKFSRIGTTSAGLLIIFENALLTQSRFMLLDAFLLLFGFTAFWLYARYRNHPRWGYLVGAAICAGLASSVKWTGITFLGIIGILECIRFFRHRTLSRLGNVALLAIIPAVLYYGIFAIHLSLLNKTGPGDAFMTPEFRKTLIGSQDAANESLVPKSEFEKFIELNREMYRANARLTASHPYSSKWYTWPLMQRPIYYWNGNTGERIYLLGNPIVWWASTFGILFILLNTVVTHDKYYWLLSGVYLVNLLPFMGIDRAMFLYHYFVGLIIAIIALVYFIESLPGLRQGFGGQRKTVVFGGLVFISLISFLFFAPLSYGRHLSDAGFNARMWMKSWR